LVPQAEAPLYLAASDLFLSPHMPNADGSAFFGSPTKLFEYMAMEKPIVASDLDQIGAVLKGTYLDDVPPSGGPVGELFKPADEVAFLGALKNVVNDPASSRLMAHRAREAALRSYTWSHHVDAILQRMQKLELLNMGERRFDRSARSHPQR
jgi:glycosyltransferase involved in cell wall biosynthesis